MADFFPDSGTDPATEEKQSAERALSLGLVTAGLGILSQPRYRGMPASVPIARGALEGLETGVNDFAGSQQQRLEQQKLRLEEEKTKSDIGYKNLEAQQRQEQIGNETRRTDIEADRVTKENAPVGEGGWQQIQPLINDPSTAPLFKGIPKETITKMPYKQYGEMYGKGVELYGKAHDPSYQLSTSTDYTDPAHPVVRAFVMNRKNPNDLTEHDIGIGRPVATKKTPDDYKRDAILAQHPEYTGHPDEIQTALDNWNTNLEGQKTAAKLQATDEEKAKDENRRAEITRSLMAETNGFKSQADVRKALLNGSKVGSDAFANKLIKDPITGKIGLMRTPIGFSPFTKPFFTELPPEVTGGLVPSAIAPGGRKLDVGPDIVAKYKTKFGESGKFPYNGKLYQVNGDSIIDVTNPPAGASPGAAPAAGPSAAPSPASAPAGAPSLAATPMRGGPAPGPVAPVAAPAAPAPAPASPVTRVATPVKAPTLYRDKNGKPLYNASTGQYLYVNEKGEYVDERGRPIQTKSGS